MLKGFCHFVFFSFLYQLLKLDFSVCFVKELMHADLFIWQIKCISMHTCAFMCNCRDKDLVFCTDLVQGQIILRQTSINISCTSLVYLKDKVSSWMFIVTNHYGSTHKLFLAILYLKSYICLFLPLSINGIPACANKKLLTDILREKWGFHGYVISDEEAVENLVLFHHYANTSMVAMIDVLEAGLNIELTTSRKDPYFFNMSMHAVEIVHTVNEEVISCMFCTEMYCFVFRRFQCSSVSCMAHVCPLP